MTHRTVAVNDQGLRIGEDHQRAKLTDAQVELMRDMHENQGVGYKRLARIFGVSPSHVRHICQYRKRAQVAKAYRPVPA